MTRFLIIAGGRDFSDYLLAISNIDVVVEEILVGGDDLVIVEGGAKGADRLGREYAEAHGIKLETVMAEWETFGRRAGPLRNEKMAMLGTDLIAFWDGKSRGTKNMIEQAQEHGLNVTVVRYNGKQQ